MNTHQISSKISFEMKIKQRSLTFDNVLLIPRDSDVLPHQVDASTSLSSLIHLSVPLLSAVMDTVTEQRTADAMARLGGLGVVSKVP